MVARKSFIIMLTNTICGVLGLLIIFIISKLWGDFAADALGVIGFSMSFVGMFSFISEMGFTHAHIKRVSEGKDIGTCIGTYIAIKLTLTAIMVAVVLGGILIWKYMLHEGFYDATKELTIYIFLGYYVFLNLAQIPVYTYTATKEIAKSQVSSLTETLVRVSLMITVAMAGVSGAYVGLSAVSGDVNIPPWVDWPEFLQPVQTFLANHAIGSLAMAYLIGNIAAFLVALAMFRGYPIKKPSMECAKNYFVFAMPMMLVSIFGTIMTNVDKVMIGFFWTSTEVGYYFAVQRLTFNLLLFSTAVGLVLFPTISSFHTKKKFREIRALTRKAERYMSLLTVPIIAFFIVFSNEIINILLSSTFLPASQTLRILSVYIFVATIRVPYYYLLIGMNKLKAFTKIAIVDFSLNIILNYLFIPSNGMLSQFHITGHNGAAVALLITTVVTLALYRLESGKMRRLPLFQKSILLHLAAGAVMSAALYFLNNYVEVVRWYTLAFFACLGLAIYLGVLIALKEFGKKDYNMLMDVVNPKGIYRYIVSELKGKKSTE